MLAHPCPSGVASGDVQLLKEVRKAGPVVESTAQGPGLWSKKVYVKTLMQQHMTSWNELEELEQESQVLRALTGRHSAFPSFVELIQDDAEDVAGGGNIHLVQV